MPTKVSTLFARSNLSLVVMGSSVSNHSPDNTQQLYDKLLYRVDPRVERGAVKMKDLSSAGRSRCGLDIGFAVAVNCSDSAKSI